MPKDDKVTVSTAYIRNLAGRIMTYADNLTPGIAQLAQVNVVAGDFPAATNLQTVTHKHRDNVGNALTNTKTVLITVAEKLLMVADQYDKDEDIRKGAVDDQLAPLINGVNAVLPGFADGIKTPAKKAGLADVLNNLPTPPSK